MDGQGSIDPVLSMSDGVYDRPVCIFLAYIADLVAFGAIFTLPHTSASRRACSELEFDKRSPPGHFLRVLNARKSRNVQKTNSWSREGKGKLAVLDRLAYGVAGPL